MLNLKILIGVTVLVFLVTACIDPTITSDVFYEPEISEESNEFDEFGNLKDPNKKEDIKVVYVNGCYDSDMAKNPYFRGVCFDEKEHREGLEDYCLNSNYLVEFYCSNNRQRGCLSERMHFCNHSCVEGACLES